MARKSSARPRPVEWKAPIAVGLVTVLAFLPILANGFVTWDDDRNFLDNPAYRGLDAGHLKWMWTTFHMGHYVPLSWMTLGLDYELWGMDARGYHLTNLVLHAANAIFLYFIARRLLRLAMPARASANGRALAFAAAFAALLFSIHPLRVESVAWATERRDVLSLFFCLATLLAYLKFTDAPAANRKWYWTSIALFLCALLSKATALTLPAVLAILNIYPLNRRDRRAWLELLPFFVLAAATAPLTLVALKPPDQLHTGGKIAVSAYSLAFYLWKTIVPTGLSPLYAMPASVNPFAARYLISYAVVIAVIVAALLVRERWPGVTVAVILFGVVIFPLLGIVQNGPQIAADRYTYHAAPALAILAGAGVLMLLATNAANAVRVGSAVVLALFAVLTWRQSLIWHDPLRFWTYVEHFDQTSSVAHTALGTLALKENRLDDAIGEYRLALKYDSTYAEGYNNLGIALARQGKIAEAATEYRRALVYSPRNRETHNNLGVIDVKLGNYEEALAEYQEAVELDPDYADAHVNWGNLLVRMNRPAEAVQHYSQAVRIDPNNADAYFNWGVALAQTNHLDDAIEAFRRALSINPGYTDARDYLDKALRLRTPDSGSRGTGAR